MISNKFFWSAMAVAATLALFFALPPIIKRLGRQAVVDTYPTKRLQINDQTLFVQIPNTPALQAKGLGGRERLADDWGMMWTYDNSRQVTFWMKDMNIALDFIWIRDGQVIGLTMNVQPPQTPVETLELIRSPEPVDRVLEVNAGYAHTHRIGVGATVTEFNN